MDNREYQRAWRAAHPEKAREYRERAKARCQADPLDAEARTERNRRARARLKERLAADPALAEEHRRKKRASERRRRDRRAAEDPEYAARIAAKANEYRQRWREKHPEARYPRTLHSRVRRYGLTALDYEELAEHQGGVCAICGRPPHSGYSRLAVDHDHATGRVRGLLCMQCNWGLGQFGDNPDRLAGAIRYLSAA